MRFYFKYSVNNFAFPEKKMDEITVNKMNI